MSLLRGLFVLFGTVTEAFWGLFVLLGTKNVLFGDLDGSPKNGDLAPFFGTSIGAKGGLFGLCGTLLELIGDILRDCPETDERLRTPKRTLL